MARVKRREQQHTLWWLAALQKVAANFGKFGEGRYVRRDPVQFKDAQGNEFELGTAHASVWAVLVALAEDISTDRANTWASLPRIMCYSGGNQKELTGILDDLETVGMIRRQGRPKGQTSVTHLFCRPLEVGERWEDRRATNLYALMSDEYGNEESEQPAAAAARVSV